MKYNEEEYRPDVEMELTDDLVGSVREAVNDWSNGIPSQPYTNLGDEIEIQSLTATILYRNELHTQYDTRSVKRGYVPYINQSVPPFVNNNPAKEKVWDYTLDLTDKFVTRDSTHTIEHSHSVEACDSCGGRGKSVCPSCNGAKTHSCSHCKGSGKVPHMTQCSSCNGHGISVYYTDKQVVRYDAYGKPIHGGVERVKHEKRCSVCGGSGQVQRGYDSCSVCRGSGRIECSSCHGTGTITCATCQGYGRLLKYLYIAQQLNHSYKKLQNVEMSDADFELMKSTVTEECYTQIDRYDNASGALKGDFAALPFVGETVTQMLAAKHSAANANNRILFESLIISRAEFIRVDYLCEGEQYSLYLTSEGKVFASHSPISVYSDALKDKAVRQARRRNLFAARRNFVQLYDITDNDKFWDMSEAVSDKMQTDMRLGSNLALVAAAVLLFPLCRFYLNEISLVAPWIDLAGAASSWTWPLLPYIYTAAALFGGYKLSRLDWGYFHDYIPTFILRLLAGVVLAAVCTALTAIVIAVAHFLILPAACETAGQIIVLPLRLIELVLGILF